LAPEPGFATTVRISRPERRSTRTIEVACPKASPGPAPAQAASANAQHPISLKQ